MNAGAWPTWLGCWASTTSHWTSTTWTPRLVVDDRDAVRRALEATDAEVLPGRGLNFRDPWGNHVQVVEYADVQFTKTPEVQQGMGAGGLGKSESALRELRDKGLGG